MSESSVAPAASDAAPARPERFGDEGQLVITTGFDLSLGYSGDTEVDDSELRIRIRPSVDRFLTRDLSLGIVLLFNYSDRTYDSAVGRVQAKATTGGLGFGFGYNVGIGRLLSWWPRVRAGVSIAGTKINVAVPTSGLDSASSSNAYTVDENWLWTDLFLPLLFHPVPHFFVGLGPYGSFEPQHDVESAHRHRFTISVATEVGGWF